MITLRRTTLEAIAGYLLAQTVPHLGKTGLVAAELEIAEIPGTSATAHADLSLNTPNRGGNQHS